MPLDSRRRFLLRALASGVTLTHASRIFAVEFWNAKDPSAWSEEEIGIITQKSPWAKAAVASYKGAEDPTGNALKAAGPVAALRPRSSSCVGRVHSRFSMHCARLLRPSLRVTMF